MSKCADPIRLSWTFLSHHEICKQRASLIAQQKRSAVDDVRNFFHGNVCDRIMRAWLSGPDPQPNVMPGMVEDYFEHCLDEIKEKESGVVRWRSVTDRRDLMEYCRELLIRLEPYLTKWILPYEYSPEYRFSVPLRIPYLDGDLVIVELVGGIDILVRINLPDGTVAWRAYDLKATANPDYVRKVRGQGVFYDIAILASFGTSPLDFTFIQPMVPKRPYEIVTVSDADRRQMLARIKDVAHDRWRGDDAPKPDAAGCSYCPVKGACSKFAGVGGFVPVRARGV